MPSNIDDFYNNTESLDDVRVDGVDDEILKGSLNTQRLMEHYEIDSDMAQEDYPTFAASFGYGGSPEADFSSYSNTVARRKESQKNAKRIASDRLDSSSRESHRRVLEGLTSDIPLLGTAIKLGTELDRWASVGLESASSFASEAIAGASGQLGDLQQPHISRLQEKLDKGKEEGTMDARQIDLAERQIQIKKNTQEFFLKIQEKAKEVSDNMDIEFGVEPEKAQSIVGQTIQIGSQIATGIGLLAANPVAGAAAFESLAYQEAVESYNEHAVNPNPEDRLKFGLTVAIPSAALDFVSGGEATIAKMLAKASVSSRKQLYAQLALSMPKEGMTEVLQKWMLTFMNNAEFGLEEEFFDGDTMKTFLIGAAGAGAAGGVISLPAILNAKTEKVLDLEGFSEEAFKTVTNSFTKEEFVENAGDNPAAKLLLEAAYDGNTKAQEAIMHFFDEGKAEESTVKPVEDKEILKALKDVKAAESEVETNLDVAEDQGDVPIRPSDPRDKAKTGFDTNARAPRAKTRAEAINRLKDVYKERIEGIKNKFQERIATLKEEAKRRQVSDKEAFVEERADLVDASKQLQGLIDSLPRSIRGDFKGFANLSKVKTLDGKLAFLDRAEARIQKLFDKEFRRSKRADLNRIVSKNLKGSPEKRAKRLGNQAADMFTEIRAITKRTPLENMERLEELLEDPKLTEDQALGLKTLFSAFNNIKGADSGRLNHAISIAESIQKTGTDFRKAFRAHETKRLEDLKDVVIESTVGSKETLQSIEEIEATESEKSWVKKAKENADEWSFSRNDALEQLIENLRTDQGERYEGPMHDAFTQMSFDATQEFHTRNTNSFQELGDTMFDVFESQGFTKKQAQKALSDFDKKNRNTGIHYKPDGNKEIQVPLSKWDAVQLWMWRQDKSLQPSFDAMGWSSKTDSEVELYIGSLGVSAGKKMLETYEQIGTDVNKVLFSIEGYEMPLVPNYSPVFKKGSNKEVDLDAALDMDTLIPATEKNRSFKERTKNKAPLRPIGAHKAFEKHISDMNHYMSFARVAKDMRNVFGDVQVKNSIRQSSGSNVANELLNSQIEDVIRGGLDKGKVDKFIGKMIGNLAVSKIALNLSSALKQLGSIPAYADAIPAGQWSVEFAKFFADVKGNSEMLLDTPYMKNRLKSSHDRDLRVIASKSFEKEVAGVRNLRDKMMILTRMGDAGAIVAGGFPVYSYHKNRALSNGMTEAEAHAEGVRQFSRATDRAQQSAEIMSQGYWQRGGSLPKLFTMFMTSPIQYNRVMIGSIKGWKKGRVSNAQLLKTITIYHVLLPQIFTAMASMGIGAFSEADEDDDVNQFWKRQRSALFIGNFNSIFMIGDAYEAVIKKLSQDASLFESSVGIPLMDQLEDFVKAADHFDDGEVVDGADDLMSALLSFGGMPYDPIRNNIEGAFEAATGATDHPVMRLLGFSDYSLMEDNDTKAASTRKGKRERRR